MKIVWNKHLHAIIIINVMKFNYDYPNLNQKDFLFIIIFTNYSKLII